MAEESIKFTGEFPAKILKWKVKHGSDIQPGSVLCIYQTEKSSVTSKFKAVKGGTVLKYLVDEGNTVGPGQDLIHLQGCTHSTVMKDLCALCGANLRNSSGKPGDRVENVSASVAMVHSVPELIVSEQEAQKIGREDETRLLRDRKLVLLVDLDQTLLHTTNDQVPARLKDVHHFQMWHGRTLMWYHTKFRPGIEMFLANISRLYELHICTFGVRMYAHIIARLLDPKGQYFSHRILSRDECFNPTSKTANLKALFPCGDSMVAIIDDREDVWNFSPNLIHVKPYQFFSGTADINAPPGLSPGGAPSGGAQSEGGEGPPSSGTDGRRKSRIVRVPKGKQAGERRRSSAGSKGNRPASDSLSSEPVAIEEETKTVGTSSPEVDPAVSGESTPDQVVVGVEEPAEDKVPDDDDADLSVSSSEDEDQDRDLPVTEKKDPETTDTVQIAVKETGEEIVTNNKQTDVACVVKTNDVVEPGAKNDKEDQMETVVVCKNDITNDSGHNSTIKHQDVADSTLKKELTEEKAESKNQTVQGSDRSVEEGRDTGGSSLEDRASQEPPGGKGKDNESDNEGEEGEEEEADDVEYEEFVEWEDPDDYLLYLEEILTRIHTAFYECYDETTKQEAGKQELPSLKKIIPYVHKKVLQGTNIVFSGVYPTNMPAEKSRAHVVARALGANVQSAFVPPESPGDKNATTHVVAARPGTQKVKQARKQSKVHIVRDDWLWTCADRWERVDERLFRLTDNMRDSPVPGRTPKRKSDADLPRDAKSARVEEEEAEGGGQGVGSAGVEQSEEPSPSTSNTLSPPTRAAVPIGGRRFSESYNPMLTFSRADIDDMDKEVEDILDAPDSDEEEGEDDDAEALQDRELRRKVLARAGRESSSEDSLSGEFPRGWKRKFRRKSALAAAAQCRSKEGGGEDGEGGAGTDQEDGEDGMEEEDMGKGPDQPHRIMRHSSDSDSEASDKDSFDESIGSVDEEMAAAVEKEFLDF